MRLTKRFGPEIVEELNRAVFAYAVEGKLLRGRRLRVDTTCVEADVRYPTDSGLCAHAVSRLTGAVDSSSPDRGDPQHPSDHGSTHPPLNRFSGGGV